MNACQTGKAIGWRTRRDIRSGIPRRWGSARWRRRCCSAERTRTCTWIPAARRCTARLVTNNGTWWNCCGVTAAWSARIQRPFTGRLAGPEMLRMTQEWGWRKSCCASAQRRRSGDCANGPGADRLAARRSALVPVFDGTAIFLAPHSVAVRGKSRVDRAERIYRVCG